MPIIDLEAASDTEAGEAVVIIPEGYYEAKVFGASYVPGDKEHIAVTYEVTGGKYDGVKVRDWYYTHRTEPKRISLENLSKLGTPTNFNPVNARQLIGKVARILVKTSEDGKYNNVHRIYQAIIDAGEYKCNVESIGRDSRNDKPFLAVAYKIESPGPFLGLRLTDNLYLSEKALGFTGTRLKRMGATQKGFNTDNNSHLNALIGNVIMVSTVPTTSQAGNPYNRITGVTLVASAQRASSQVIEVSAEVIAGLSNKVERFDEGFENDKF